MVYSVFFLQRVTVDLEALFYGGAAMAVHLDGILNQVRALPSAEQRELRALLDDILKEASSDSEQDALERKLLEAGLLREIKPPIADSTPYRNRRPAKLKGRGTTASQLIIEERR